MLRSKASSSAVAVPQASSGRDPALAAVKSGFLLDMDHSQFDLLTVLTYLSSVSTANLSREQIFDSASRLGYAPSPYFAQVDNLVQTMGYDYSHACHVVARSTKDEVIRQFLLRFGNSMASGEPEPVFLAREAQVVMEDYTNQYERAIEALKKWTDAFVAMMVSCTLIVVVALISNMIYSIGSMFLLMIEGVAVIAAVLGAYLIYRIAPYDPIVHNMDMKSEEQERISLAAKICLPAAVVVTAGAYFVLGTGVAFVLGGLIVLPLGLLTLKLEQKIDARDRDIADFLRSLGGVTSARGATVIESLHHIDQRAIGSLEPELKRLLTRVACGLNTSLCWVRFMADTGSEMVHRVVRAFWDGNDWGGEAEKIGKFTADVALRVWLLRAKRKLVSTTFNYVIIPMHLALMGTLVFITEVVSAFNDKLLDAQALSASENTSSIRPEDIGIPGALAFQSFDTGFLNTIVMVVIVCLTFVNAFAARSASGGHRYKTALFASITMVCSGLILLIVPQVAASMFSDTLADTPPGQ
jgi:flagellar protein FlaJ